MMTTTEDSIHCPLVVKLVEKNLNLDYRSNELIILFQNHLVPFLIVLRVVRTLASSSFTGHRYQLVQERLLDCIRDLLIFNQAVILVLILVLIQLRSYQHLRSKHDFNEVVLFECVHLFQVCLILNYLSFVVLLLGYLKIE